jgi:hypothetical protein
MRRTEVLHEIREMRFKYLHEHERGVLTLHARLVCYRLSSSALRNLIGNVGRNRWIRNQVAAGSS